MSPTPANGRARPLLVSLTALSLLLLSACSNSASTTSAPTTPGSTTSAPTESPSGISRTSGCATHLQDGTNAPMKKFTGLRGVRYGEINLLCRHQGSSMYNTTGLNNQANPEDTAPADLWNSSSEDAVAKQYDVRTRGRTAPAAGQSTISNCP